MVKECPILVNNDQVTVVKFNNTDVQFPSIKKNCKSVFVNFENGKYSIVEKPVVNKEPEKKQPIWCDEGGSKHWQGSGANEHGYYKTWDDAWAAAQAYMKGSMSGNFMVRQCPCGLYYYWVKKDN